MRICWPAHRSVEAVGAAYGYTTASSNLLAATSRVSGVTIVEPDDSPDVALHFCHPHNFFPIAGCKNIIFTMYEFDPLPVVFRETARLADLVIVPSEFCRTLFNDHIDTSKTRVAVSPLGIDPDFWKPVEHRPPSAGEPFQFLFVGDLNQRKGYHLLMEAWGAVFADIEGVRLYMKLSGGGPTDERRCIERGNVICDFRSLRRSEMTELFARSHAFVFPSMGEGWGLTAMEAAAAGLPLISTRCGGVDDFLDDRLTWWIPSSEYPVRVSSAHGGGIAMGVRAHPHDVACAMRDVLNSYPAALKMARKQAKIVQKYTWDRAAQSMLNILESLVVQRRAA